MRRMIPLGFEMTPAGVATLAGFLFVGGVAIALPATVTLAVVGYRRDLNRPRWSAFKYWLLGNALTLPSMAGLAIFLHVGRYAVPLAWAPALILAWYLHHEDHAEPAPQDHLNPWIRRNEPEPGWDEVSEARPSWVQANRPPGREQ